MSHRAPFSLHGSYSATESAEFPATDSKLMTLRLGFGSFSGMPVGKIEQVIGLQIARLAREVQRNNDFRIYAPPTIRVVTTDGTSPPFRICNVLFLPER